MKISVVTLLVWFLLLNLVQFVTVTEGAAIQKRETPKKHWPPFCHFKICNMGRPRKPKTSARSEESQLNLTS
ncbi:hypothetical protein HNY73_018286 [Argiope bruennichi]|uniref:Uncharacterized protein n=1 Tax=Argiope bruennichi TaxID=94029 RepID=A0A8T0EDJ7_ARGBR|nr:hypothetical protein HNY73_018286 [Argiope bruennichi]